MAEEEVKLYGVWYSPYSSRVELALQIKGVAYEFIEEDLNNKSSDLFKHFPVHKETVLVHNGKAIAGSLLILEYIDETWPANPLLPKNPYVRAIARYWGKFVDEQILAAVYKASMAKDQEERDQAVEEVRQQLKFLEDELKGMNFFEGERIRYLDIVVFDVFYMLKIWQAAIKLDVINERSQIPAFEVRRLMEGTHYGIYSAYI